jgi:hypothetical protein
LKPKTDPKFQNYLKMVEEDANASANEWNEEYGKKLHENFGPEHPEYIKP